MPAWLPPLQGNGDLAVTLQPAGTCVCRRSQSLEKTCSMVDFVVRNAVASSPVGPSLSSRTCTDQLCYGSWADLITQECAAVATLVAIQHECVVNHELAHCTHFSRTASGSVDVLSTQASIDQSRETGSATIDNQARERPRLAVLRCRRDRLDRGTILWTHQSSDSSPSFRRQ